MMYGTLNYTTADNVDRFREWLDSIASENTKDKIAAYIARLRKGVFGNCKPLVGIKDIYELVMDFGPGYRVYYAHIQEGFLLLLTGGTKRTQKRDMKTANKYYQVHLSRKKQNVKSRKL